MVIVTYIYSENERTKQMVDSFKRFGYEVAIVKTDTHRGNGTALKLLYECYQRASTGHISFMYADAADSYCQRKFFAPYDKVVWQTEKNCYPHPHVANNYPNLPTKYVGSPWKFLNNGGYYGSTKLVCEFFETYGLNNLPPEANGQHETMMAYIKAKADGFPIYLDDGCEVMQSMAFSPDMEDFELVEIVEPTFAQYFSKKLIRNKVTGQIPAVLHFNGLTDMSILKSL